MFFKTFSRDVFDRGSSSSNNDPTGVLVRSDSDKITVGPECYIWLPKELEELVTAHSLISEKFFKRKNVDIYHPKTLLFVNSNGQPIGQIECKHLKEFTGLPITAYDFR